VQAQIQQAARQTQHNSNQPGPKSGASSVVFRLGSEEAQAWGELGSIQAREIG
jgi:hypothetical protein